MKKEYQEPIIEVIELDDNDIIVTSSLGKSMPGDNETPWIWS